MYTGIELCEAFDLYDDFEMVMASMAEDAPPDDDDRAWWAMMTDPDRNRDGAA